MCYLSLKKVAEVLTPKIKDLFYDSSSKRTTPSCGISVSGDFNPLACFHGYDAKCPASQTLPFFMDDFGPKYTEYTTASHEQLPGHHLEVTKARRYLPFCAWIRATTSTGLFSLCLNLYFSFSWSPCAWSESRRADNGRQNEGRERFLLEPTLASRVLRVLRFHSRLFCLMASLAVFMCSSFDECFFLFFFPFGHVEFYLSL